ncbi:hypothetical protein GCM10027612_59500 [Microbispora bryophytorum subsp. camponoti]
MKSLARRLRLDLSPLREFRDFRLLLGSGLITMLGTVITTVAVPFQMKQLTESYVAVGLVGMAEFVPMVVCGLWGGAIADARDRRTIVILSELGLCLSSVLLLVNALLPRPQVWVLYAAGALAAGLGSLRRPSEQALINRVLPLDRMPAAFAVQGLVLNAAMIAGPAAGVSSWPPSVRPPPTASTSPRSCCPWRCWSGSARSPAPRSPPPRHCVPCWKACGTRCDGRI